MTAVVATTALALLGPALAVGLNVAITSAAVIIVSGRPDPRSWALVVAVGGFGATARRQRVVRGGAVCHEHGLGRLLGYAAGTSGTGLIELLRLTSSHQQQPSTVDPPTSTGCSSGLTEQLSQVGDDDVGAVSAQLIGLPDPVDADHAPEATRPSRRHS